MFLHFFFINVQTKKICFSFNSFECLGDFFWLKQEKKKKKNFPQMLERQMFAKKFFLCETEKEKKYSCVKPSK